MKKLWNGSMEFVKGDTIRCTLRKGEYVQMCIDGVDHMFTEGTMFDLKTQSAAESINTSEHAKHFRLFGHVS